MEFNRERIPCEEFYLLIPVGLLLCYVAGVLLAFYGRDERTGWMFSRGFAIDGLWKQFALDESRTCIYWNDRIDLASDSVYEYGKEI